MWHQLTITYQKDCDFECLNAFSLPVDGKILMIPGAIYNDPHDLYLLDCATMVCEQIPGQQDIIQQYASGELYHPTPVHPGRPFLFRGKSYDLIGLYGGHCLPQNCYGEHVVIEKIGGWFKKFDRELVVRDRRGELLFRHPLHPYPYDAWYWDVVTFTPDGEFILFWNPASFAIFKRE